MWSRVVEIMLGCWLLISPFIFQHESGQVALWANDLGCGTAVILFALFSYWHPTRHAHVATMAVALWLIGFAYWHGFGSAPPASQNHVILGMLLGMFAVIPNEATRPAPAAWEESISEDSNARQA